MKRHYEKRLSMGATRGSQQMMVLVYYPEGSALHDMVCKASGYYTENLGYRMSYMRGLDPKRWDIPYMEAKYGTYDDGVESCDN